MSKDARRSKRAQRRALNWNVGLPGLCTKSYRKVFLLNHGIDSVRELVRTMYKENSED